MVCQYFIISNRLVLYSKTNTSNMNSDLFKVNLKDVAKGLAVCVIVALLGAFKDGITAHGFDFASFDWAGIVNVASMAFVGYISKNFLSDSSGKFLGRIG